MQIGTGEFQYQWHDHWARVPDNDSAKTNGRTHAVMVSKSGDVIVFAQCNPAVLIFDGSTGKVKSTWGDRFTGAHGMTLVEESGVESLWLVDQDSHEVCKTTLDGKTLATIAQPKHQAYATGKYVPTWAAANPANGDVWVADGYGSSLVHRHDKAGRYLSTIDGTEGAGRFACPHGIAFCPTTGHLWIADRGNRRITIYDGQGKQLRHIDQLCHSPCGFSFAGPRVLVPELFTGVKLLDVETLKCLAELGAGVEVSGNQPGQPARHPQGWPNLAGTSHIKPGYFNSPHGGCLTDKGDIYVAEWIIGGRVTQLKPCA